MPVTARLQGSFCAPMERNHYHDQVKGLRKYAATPEIPPDPDDITTGAAQTVMRYYDLALSLGEERTYQYAIDNSDETEPCCCQSGRWRAYGGLGKLLVREHHFTGKQPVEYGTSPTAVVALVGMIKADGQAGRPLDGTLWRCHSTETLRFRDAQQAPVALSRAGDRRSRSVR